MKNIQLLQTGSVVEIVLQKPPVNIITIEMMGELIMALKEASNNPECKVILLRGDGKCFSAGTDVKEHLPDKVKDMIGKFDKLLHMLLAVPVPTVAALHGAALGGAFEIGSLCDITLSTDTCKLGLPEIRLGVFPPVAAALYPKIIGLKNAFDVILSGRDITPKYAQQIGLVNEVYADGEFMVKVKDYIRNFEELSRSSLIICKKTINFIAGLPEDDSLSLASINLANSTYLRELMNTEDALEGLNSFLEKRKPVWKNK